METEQTLNTHHGAQVNCQFK